MHQNGMGMGRGHGNKNYGRPGPLMTDHLQIRNLDRELEILRRKRESVQREQRMLTMESDMDRKRQYEHTNRNVPKTYGNVWQPPPPKRANHPQRPNPWMTTSHDSVGPHMSNMPKSIPSNYIPSLLNKRVNPSEMSAPMKPFVPPLLKNPSAHRLGKPMNTRNDFRPTNVFKSKVVKTAPNKLNTYPLKERKDLVARATGSPVAHDRVSKCSTPDDSDSEMVLRENQVPNNQVNGRLELALGSIVKEIRSSNVENEKFIKLIANVKYQRTLKQAVRERIRSVMLNKPVGSVTVILKMYREKYSKESDKEVVELVINSEQLNVDNVNVIETEDPVEFFKKNVTSILEKKIQEMAAKLLKLYRSEQRKSHLDLKKAADASKKPDENESKNDIAMKVIRSLTGKYVTVEEKNALNDYYTELIERVIEKKLPEHLPKCAEQFLKIFEQDRRLNNFVELLEIRHKKDIKEELKSEELKTEELKTEHLENQNDGTIETADNNENETCDDNMEKDDNDKIEEEVSNEDTTEANKSKEATEIIPDMMDTDESSTTSKTEPAAPLPKDTESTETIKQTTSLDSGSVLDQTETTETIAPTNPSDAESVASVVPSTPLAKQTASPQTTPVTKIVTTPSANDLPYYVKLIGRPKLPTRPVICDFLNKYRPSSIKKHKSINNLLVVGFNNQEDYNKILTANETVLGDITILIKASEKVSPKENESINEGNDAKKDAEASNEGKNNVKDGNKIDEEVKDGENVDQEVKNGDNTDQEVKDADKIDQEAKDENETCTKSTDNSDAPNNAEEKDLIGKELDDQISDLLSNIKEAENNDSSNKTPSLEPVKEDGEEVKPATESEKVEKVEKVAKVKESGRATPVRSSSRLGNMTPSSIRTRRSSRFMQE